MTFDDDFDDRPTAEDLLTDEELAEEQAKHHRCPVCKERGGHVQGCPETP